jgi:copper homeostasis protein
MTLLEVCIDTAAGLRAAMEGGADRVELCSALEVGGLTPQAGLMSLAAAAGVTARIMIRPRSGDFVFNADEIDQMHAEILAARAYGLEGFVLGASLPDGRLDTETLARLIETAGDTRLTLHRAFDLVPDIEEAVEAAIDLGFDTILTSGRAPTGLDGLADITRAHAIAAGRITIMAGAGINPETARTILASVPLKAVHGSCSVLAPAESPAVSRFGFSIANRRITDSKSVTALKKSIS